MAYNEEDFLQLSGLQHFNFCRRQWALIHLEQQWAENFRTADGSVVHRNAHDSGYVESRGDRIITRGVRIFSARLGVSGQCDVLEYHRSPEGISLPGRSGNWIPYPVEYKRGSPRNDMSDALQLCGQAMCLEEMLCCDIPSGALYYHEIRRRTEVSFTPELRETVRSLLQEMHALTARRHTPKVKPTKACNACSLKDVCLPVLLKRGSVEDYIKKAKEESD